MKILVVTDSLADTDGVGRYTLRLYQAVEKVAPHVELRFLLPRKHPPNSVQLPGHWSIVEALPPTHLFHMARWKALVWRLLSRGELMRGARWADIVHSTKDWPHAGLALDAARRAGKPCVMTAHGTYAVLPLDDARHRRAMRAAYPRFAKVVCVSHFTRRLIEERLPDLANLEVMHNRVDASHYSGDATQLLDQPWRGLKFIAGVGPVKERKGHHLGVGAFLRIAEKYPEYHLFIAGQVYPEDPYALGLRRRVAESGLSDRVHFMGVVTEAQKVDLLRGAEIFLHAPVTARGGGFEGFGIVYLEAAACGVPSIATTGSGAEDAVQHEQTGLLVSPAEQDIARALDRLLGQPSLCKRLGAQALAAVLRQSWDDNAQRCMEIFEEARKA